MDKLTIKDLDLRGKRVFMRVDFNVPLKDGVVTDDTRIRETIPTLKLAIEKGGRLVLASHLGRPKGGPDSKYSLQPGRKEIGRIAGPSGGLCAWIASGPGVESQSKALVDGEVLVLENVRFHPEEEKNDEAFSKQLAALCDGLFVCDAFGSAHRAHASVVGITRFVQQSAAGLLMEKELAYLGKAVSNPARPFVAILGGAKVSDKIEVVENLMKIADAMLIGGGMAYTFLKAQGLPIGKSLVENDKIDLAKKILADAKSRNFKFLLPTDHVIAAEFKADAACDHRVMSRRLPRIRWVWTSALKRLRLTRRKSAKQRPSSGTGRWACSRCRPSPRARWKWRKRWRPRRCLAQLRSLVAEIRSRRCSSLAWRSKFHIFLLAEALRWNFLAAANCPALRR